MGAAIVLVRLQGNKRNNLQVILVAPHSEFFRKTLKNFLLSRNVFPELKLDGSNFIKVRRQTIQVLEKLAEDQFFYS